MRVVSTAATIFETTSRKGNHLTQVGPILGLTEAACMSTFRSRSIRRRARPTSHRISCSQMRSTLHPRPLSDPSTRLSRCRFRRILAIQKVVFVFGFVPCRGQPCQKHPSTNTATRERRNAMSGLPGSPTPLLSRHRIPAWRSAVRRASSGAVPERRTLAIRRLRSGVVGRAPVSVAGRFLTLASG